MIFGNAKCGARRSVTPGLTLVRSLEYGQFGRDSVGILGTEQDTKPRISRRETRGCINALNLIPNPVIRHSHSKAPTVDGG